jgi:hypothetical protein
VATSLPSRTGAADATSPEARDAFLARLVPPIVAGLHRSDTDAPVFRGSIDWHSSVHAHWALLRIARVTGRHAEAAALADRSLSPKGLAAERIYLAERPAFEMPYGRAWFLRLAIEHDRWSRASNGKDPERLRPLARTMAASLREHLASLPKPTPATPEYANPCWALAQLAAWYAFLGDDAGVAWVRDHVAQRYLRSAAEVSFADDAGRPEFFSRFGNWAYVIARTQDAAALATFLAQRPVADAALAPVVPDGKVAHAFGMNWSRAWDLGTLARCGPERDRPRFRGAFEAHVAAGTKDHDRFAGDVWAYDHWVPQFAVYALTDGD